MGNKNKNAVPEKIKGIIRIAGKDYEVGSMKSAGESSSRELQIAVKKLSKKRFFSLPTYAINE